MATLSNYLFATGGLLLLFAFVLGVAYTTMLAVGRRTAGTSQLAAAGPDGGASVLAHQRCATPRRRYRGRHRPRLDLGQLHAHGRLAADPRGHRRAGAMGQHVRVLHRLRGGHPRRLPLPAAPLPASARIAFLPLGVALFLVGYAASLPSAIEPLVPALDNPPLLTIHVAMAMIAYGVLAVSFAAAVGYLAQGEDDRFSWLPTHKVLDEVAYRSVVIGFPIFATMIILGSYWASIAWGRYWGWDPKETSALVTWLIYAVYLHARSQASWRGRPAALILVIGFGAVLFTYFGNLFFSGLHSYSGL